MDDVIEPSEIIIEGKSEPKRHPVPVNPWLRFLARFFDYSLFFLLLLGLQYTFRGQSPFGKYEHLIPFEFFIWIPFEALFLFLWGKTPGKWFLGIELKPKRKFDYMSALKRCFAVWFRGLGMGIPIINCLCLLVAYQRLKLFKTTSWDRDDQIQVIHHPIARWRLISAAIITLFGLLFYYSWNY